MIGLALLILAQAVMHVPVTGSGAAPNRAAEHSIVVATAIDQTNPRAIACGEPACTSWFTARFGEGETIVGRPLPPKFSADLEMGSPYDQPYRLVLVVEHGPDGLRVVDQLGFHYETHDACFGPAIAALFPDAAGERLVRMGRTLCVKER